MDISVVTPKGTLKRRVGENLHVEIVVSGEDPGDLIVELWAPLSGVDAHPLTCDAERNLFTLAIELDESGYFPLQFRARRKDQKFWTWAGGDEKTTISLWVDPAWIYDAIVYNVFVRYFGAKTIERDGQVTHVQPGTFADIKVELEKLSGMGINVLYLNPVYMIGELYRKYNPHDLLPEYLQPGCPYSIKDYKSIDPELSFGKDTDSEHPFYEFHKLVDEAHRLGIRVVMDLVFNHSAHDAVFQRLHPEWFLYKEHILNLEEPYIYPEEIKEGKPWGDPKHTFASYDHGWWWDDTAQLNWNNIKAYPDFIMPQLASNEPPENPTIADMYQYFKNIVKFWIKEFGIDGFRCDVAYRVPKDFWRDCIIEARKTAKRCHPANGSLDGDVIFIAEDYHVDIAGLLDAGFTACYGDFSNKLTAVPEITGYLNYMYNIGGEHFPDGSMWFIFPECHDFHRNPEKIAKDLREQHADADLNANKSRWTITACLPGIPMIFNGFEKIEWEPASLFSYSTVDWESDKDISEHIAKVNLIRRSEPALQRGGYYYLHTSEGIAHEGRIFSFARILGEETIIVVVNMDIVARAEYVKIHLPDALPIDFTKPYVLDDLLNGEKYDREGHEVTVILDPGEAHIFKVRQ
jgi:glycosidase